MFLGNSQNLSMEEIYGVNYNSSILQFTSKTIHQNPSTIELSLTALHGMDGRMIDNTDGLLGFSQLNSAEELCVTFFILWDAGLKNYHLNLRMYAERNSIVSMRAFMSLPNQARSFDQLQLIEFQLRDNEMIDILTDVYSLHFLNKRSTVQEPCIEVNNYDKVILNKKHYK
jgi:hypothetical protein